MINPSIFKAYDVRGIYPDEVNPQAVRTIAKACAKMFDEGEMIIAHDARHGSKELIEVLERGLKREAKAIGKNMTVRNVGLSTTPMFYFLVNHFGAVGGCMITASHNPKNYNGLKIVTKGAKTISGTDVLKVVQSLA